MRHHHTCRSMKQQELSAANQQLTCVETDLNSMGSSAAAAGVDSPSDAPSNPDAARFDAVAAPQKPALPIAAATGSLDHLNLGSHRRQASQAPFDTIPRPDMPGTSAAAGSGMATSDAGDTHAQLIKSKEARMLAHFEELQGQYLAKCGTGGPAAEAQDPLSAAQLRRKRGRDRGRGNAPVANDHQAALQAFSQEIEGTCAPLAVRNTTRFSDQFVNHPAMIMSASHSTRHLHTLTPTATTTPTARMPAVAGTLQPIPGTLLRAVAPRVGALPLCLLMCQRPP